MLENEEIMNRLASGVISLEEAIDELTGERATDGTGLSIGTIVAIQKPGEKLQIKSSGYRDWHNSAKIEDNDTARIFSITKGFVAEAMQQLCDEGKIQLTDNLADWIEKISLDPEVKDACTALNIDKKAIIEDLLLHNAGIGNYSHPENTFSDFASCNPGYIWTICKLLKYNVKNSKYGSFEYSDSNHNLLALIIEHIEKTTYQESVHKKVIKPFNLENTYFLDEKPQLKAYGYIENPDTGEPEDYKQYDTGKAAGGLISTIEDLIKFGQKLYAKRQGELGKTIDIPQDSTYFPKQQYSRAGAVLQKDLDDKPVWEFPGNARGGKSRLCCYNDGTVIAIIETWETITVKIAKQLVDPKDKTAVIQTTLAIREAFSDKTTLPPKYNREAMRECFNKDRELFDKKVAESQESLPKSAFTITEQKGERKL